MRVETDILVIAAQATSPAIQPPATPLPVALSQQQAGLAIIDLLSARKKKDMSRQRLQRDGDLYKRSGWWKLRWREDVIDGAGRLKRRWSTTVTIGPCEGALALTEKEAQRIAWDSFLSRLDQNNKTPASVMTLAEFVQAKFMNGHVKYLKPSGQIHYKQMLTNHILPVLGTARMRDMRRDHVQQLIDLKADQGLSWQTQKHIRNAVSAVFTFAAQEDCFTGVNPAKHVRMGEKTVVRETNALTVGQLNDVLMLLDTPYKEMALVAVMASLNVAQICGLRWKRLNLTDTWGTSDGEALPPWTLLVCEQFYRGKYGSLKTKARRRVVPIPTVLRPLISNLRVRGHHTGPDDPVFCSRKGTPVDEHNIARRHLTPIGKKLEFHLSWHVFRRTHVTLAKEAGMSLFDRMASAGHSDVRTSILYTKESIDSRLVELDRMGSKITVQ